jgi:hypothetical protein
MRTGTAEIVQKFSLGVVGVISSWTLQDISVVAAIAVSLMTFVYMGVQTLKVLRDWYLNEKKIRREEKLAQFERRLKSTDHGDLS